MDLNLPFVCCSICQLQNTQSDLFLTSCAHILCKEHARKNAQDPNRLESTKTKCLMCNHDRVSLVKIDERLPIEIVPFFTPFPVQIEQMFASAQFQYTGLLERMNYQKQIILKLNEKVNKQKNLLILAKEKVLKVEELENRIKILERENRELSISKLQSPSNGDIRNPPATVDLTIDDNSFEQEQENLDSRRDRRTVAASFIDQIKKNSTNSKFPSYRSSTSHIPHESNNQAIVTKNSDHDDNSYFAKSRIGESTNILQNSPIRSIPSNISHSNYSSRSSSIGSLNTSISSHDNFIQPVPWTKLSAPHPLSTSNNLDAPRVSKSRASTSSLAQRLSAHMKVGNSLINRRSESTGTTRPGSSFTNNSSIFKRR